MPLVVSLALGLSGCTLATLADPDTAVTNSTSSAEGVYRSYIGAMNDLDIDDIDSWSALLELTSEDIQAVDSTFLSFLHGSGSTMSGETVIAWFRERSTESDGSVEAIACLDMSSVVFHDPTGTGVRLDDSSVFQEVKLRFVEEDEALVLAARLAKNVDRC